MEQLITAQVRKVRADLQGTTSLVTASTVSLQGPDASTDGERSKLAHNISMRWKDYDEHFSGDLGECWIDYLDEYPQIAKEYGINTQKMLQIFTTCWKRRLKGTTSPR